MWYVGVKLKSFKRADEGEHEEITFLREFPSRAEARRIYDLYDPSFDLMQTTLLNGNVPVESKISTWNAEKRGVDIVVTKHHVGRKRPSADPRGAV